MVVFGKGCCIREKVAVVGQKRFYSGKSVFFSGKSGCNPARWLYSGKSGSIQAIVFVFWQTGCIWAKVVVVVQKRLYSSKSGYIRAIRLF